MSADWIAGSTRARALASRRIGTAAARDLARCEGLPQAVADLVSSPYGHDVRAGQRLAVAQHNVAAVVLWHLRVLAGWLPMQRTAPLRVLARGFEIANLAARCGELQGREPVPLFRLGGLASAAAPIAAARSLPELRRALVAAGWGDPGGDEPASLLAGARLLWAGRVAGTVPGARTWAQAIAAITVARMVLLEGRTIQPTELRNAAVLLGRRWRAATDPQSFAEGLPRQTRWVFDGITETGQLWRAEAGLWSRIGDDGEEMLRRPLTGPEPVVGCAAVLAADAWRVRAALEVAARRGPAHEAALEVFDVVV